MIYLNLHILLLILWYLVLFFRKIYLFNLLIKSSFNSVIFFLNVALTALSLVIEQNDGTQDRVWITGRYIYSNLMIVLFFCVFRCKIE